MGYYTRKQIEMAHNTSFTDLSRVLYLGSWDLSKIMGYNPRKLPEIAVNTSFADPSRVVCRGSQGIEILPGLKNHGL